MLPEQISQIIAPQHRSRRRSVRVSVIAVLVCFLQSNHSNPETFAQQQGTRATASDRNGNTTGADYRIGEVRAYLWHETQGSLATDDILRLPPGSLWNIPFGPNRTPSSRTVLIIIELAGPPDGSEPPRMLHFSATARLLDGRRSLLLSKSVSIRELNAAGRYHVPFLLQDIGCVPIELHAEIRGQRNKVSADRVLDFRCGE